MAKVTVRVPATSANLGPGFDTLGLALSVYNVITVEEAGTSLCITGCPEQYANEGNLAFVAYCAAMQRMGLAVPRGLSIHIAADIPVARGLGSSAALLVGGAVAANALHGNALTKRDILAVCTAIEGHPDNVAPALYGGLIASLMQEGKPVTVQYPVHPALCFTALVPDFETSTHQARAVLPESVPYQDAAFNLSRLAVLLRALVTADTPAIAAAADDRLHQPYRKGMIEGYEMVRALALRNGCDAFVISGSGSTCLAIGGDAGFPDAMRQALLSLPGTWRVLPLAVDVRGARVLSQ